MTVQENPYRSVAAVERRQSIHHHLAQPYVNLACGSTFVEGDPWINLDYAPSSVMVQSADLLAPLPFANDSVAVIYSSHFLEHVPRSRVPGLLAECFRVLRPGGVLRLVMPDLEEMCREYLARRDAGDHEKADLVVVEMIDQCVRLTGGGELGALYRTYSGDPGRYATMMDYLNWRNGENLRPVSTGQAADRGQAVTAPRPTRSRPFLERITTLPSRVRKRAQNAWFAWLLQRLPAAFREQNVSLASVGERHHWLWDRHQLTEALRAAGFEHIERCTCDTGRIDGFPFFPLDVDDDGRARKGAESMYVEASKPC
ncbi:MULTISPECIES: methyltransferase domain-containing protein [unclassified Thiocapsa]|uniref:class I SAM-dependent methyltransferase n=1 Tax=unclassified Thiocapsa TaxID=2641286 RepID=UPI0035B2DED8